MLHRFFHFLKQSLLVVLCILLLGGLLAGGWFFYQAGSCTQCRQQLPSGFHVRHHLCPRELYFLRCAAADLY